MTHRKSIVILAVGFVIFGCNPVTVGSDLKVPPDAAATCTKHCESIGLTLSAVAIMANNVGCVCQPAPTGKVALEAAPAAGMVTILMQQQAQRSQESSRRR
jgi:hypothetical protein